MNEDSLRANNQTRFHALSLQTVARSRQQTAHMDVSPLHAFPLRIIDPTALGHTDNGNVVRCPHVPDGSSLLFPLRSHYVSVVS